MNKLSVGQRLNNNLKIIFSQYGVQTLLGSQPSAFAKPGPDAPFQPILRAYISTKYLAFPGYF